MKKSLLLSLLASSTFALAQTYNNGGLNTGPVSNSGVAAPANTNWSEVQNDNATESNTSSGFGVGKSGPFFLADDFTVPANEKWTLVSATVFAYQTGFTGTTSPFNALTLNLFNSNPSQTGATSVFGDDTTNRLATTADALLYRIFNSTVPTATPTGTTRRIWSVTGNLATTLQPGTYWMKYQINNAGSTAIFAPPVTIPKTRGLPSWNATQLNGATDIWAPLIDAGNPATAPDFAQDMPFIITYTVQSLGTTETREMDNRVQVYPNPTSNFFKLALPQETKVSKTKISLYDMAGRMVKEFNVSDTYNISDLPKGQYLVKVKDGESIKVTKLIKK